MLDVCVFNSWALCTKNMQICVCGRQTDRQTDTDTNEGTLVWLVTCVSISCVAFSTYVATNLLVCLLKKFTNYDTVVCSLLVCFSLAWLL